MTEEAPLYVSSKEKALKAGHGATPMGGRPPGDGYHVSDVERELMLTLQGLAQAYNVKVRELRIVLLKVGIAHLEAKHLTPDAIYWAIATKDKVPENLATPEHPGDEFPWRHGYLAPIFADRHSHSIWELCRIFAETHHPTEIQNSVWELAALGYLERLGGEHYILNIR